MSTANLSQRSEIAHVELGVSVMLALIIACVTSCNTKGLFEVLVELLAGGRVAMEMLFEAVSFRIRHLSFIARID